MNSKQRRKNRRKDERTLSLTSKYGPRIHYDQRQKFQVKYGTGVICGYMRIPRIKDEIVTGLCSLLNIKCQGTLPIESDRCSVYQEWLEKQVGDSRSINKANNLEDRDGE